MNSIVYKVVDLEKKCVVDSAWITQKCTIFDTLNDGTPMLLDSNKYKVLWGFERDGKQYFEGDILGCKNPDVRSEIYFEDGVFKGYRSGEISITPDYFDIYEVIGNIYLEKDNETN